MQTSTQPLYPGWWIEEDSCEMCGMELDEQSKFCRDCDVYFHWYCVGETCPYCGAELEG